MQFIDLQKQYKILKSEIDAGIQGVMDRTDFIMGKEVTLLEEQLADYVGMKHCITCGNGTDALLLALLSYDIKQGDAVFVPTFTFFATAEMVSRCGATPIFIDIDCNTFNLSATDLECGIKEILKEGKLRPRAIVAVDLFGLPADYNKIRKVAEEYNLLIIEDGAQGFGGSINGQKACSFGDIATTSFFPAKPLGCYGDGGAVFTNEEKVSDYIKSLRVHGKDTDKYDNVRIGMNSRLDTIQAAILLVKLKAFRKFELESRNNVANIYNEKLSGFTQIPYCPEEYTSSYAQYSILLKEEAERDLVQKTLGINGIPTMIYYKKSLHQQIVYRNNDSIYRGFPNAERITKTILNLPIHPYLSEDQIIKCTNIIKSTLEEI